jgi:GH18 family chitinase
MNFKIIAYYLDRNGDLADIDFTGITHFNYSFALPTADGGLAGHDVDRLRELVRRGHEQGVKVSLAIGGWNDGDCTGFERMSGGAGNRGNFIRNVLETCDRFGLDGIDIDWEYPKAHSAADFTVLMRELRAALGPKRLLTTAVIAEGDEYGKYIHSEVFAHIDCLNIMAYDWLYQAPGTHHSPLSLADSCLDYWIGRGCPAEKAVLGLPFYGRSPKVSANYRELVLKDPMAPFKDQVGEIQYNGLETIRAKTRIAKRRAGGVMFWEITQDTRGDSSLLAAINEAARS